jgi:hypothetical protein
LGFGIERIQPLSLGGPEETLIRGDEHQVIAAATQPPRD